MANMMLQLLKTLIILFVSLFLQPSSSNHPSTLDHGLLKKLHEVAGVYKDESKRKGLEKTVIITTSNYGYLNHLHNFKCFADRLDIRFLVLAMDIRLKNYLAEHTNMVSYLLRAGAVGNVTSNASSWQSMDYYTVVNKKTEAVYTVLSHGFDLLFAEVDIAIVRDPFPYLNYPDMHYIHSVNLFCLRFDDY